MPRINCTIIPEPQEGTRPITKKNGSKTEPFIIGTGEIDYICGRCDNIIAHNVSQGQIASDAVYQCPNCQTFNEVEKVVLFTQMLKIKKNYTVNNITYNNSSHY